MQWYYAEAGVQHGPLTETEFLERIRSGQITRSSPVWSERMATWLPFHEVEPALLPRETAPAIAPPPIVCTSADNRCIECGLTFAPEDLVQVSGHRVCAGCKPMLVQKLLEGVPVLISDSEEIRKRHIRHEASIRTVGILYVLGGVLMISIGVIAIAASLSPAFPMGIIELFGALIFLVFGGAHLSAGLGLRKLRPWTQVVAGILSGLGLLVLAVFAGLLLGTRVVR